MKLLCILFLLFSISTAYSESVLNSEPIAIGHELKRWMPRKRKLTNSQLIRNARKRSTRQNIKLISKEIEQIEVTTGLSDEMLKKEDKDSSKKPGK